MQNEYLFTFMTTQEKRHKALQDLISEKNVEDQASLVELLKKRYGIESNQTMVSRDLRQMGATKRMVAGKMVYELPQRDASEEILKLAVRKISHNESLIVIDTLPGLANFVGDYIDLQEEIGVLGTLAGENVLFITPLSTKEIKKVYQTLCTLCKYKVGS